MTDQLIQIPVLKNSYADKMGLKYKHYLTDFLLQFLYLEIFWTVSLILFFFLICEFNPILFLICEYNPIFQVFGRQMYKQ